MPKANAQAHEDVPPSSRARLVAAAAELIGQGDWDAVTTRATAAAAGVNQGLVHYHFDSIEALRREALFALMSQAKDEPLAQVSQSTTLSEALIELATRIDEMDDTVARSGGMLDAIAGARRDAASAELAASFASTYLERYTEALRGKLPEGSDDRDLAVALAAFLHGLSSLRWLTPGLDVVAATKALLAALERPRPRPD